MQRVSSWRTSFAQGTGYRCGNAIHRQLFVASRHCGCLRLRLDAGEAVVIAAHHLVAMTTVGEPGPLRLLVQSRELPHAVMAAQARQITASVIVADYGRRSSPRQLHVAP